ncbi:hypothetical protein BGV68_22235 [Burkholderia ubonensis]|nr:hypothetical protein [Burkholderia ubonensis]OJA51657.1 hypothetical protein BGV68_22235 [Burkholderia ubonensis]OJB21359.1 hypothetical protein BGV54_17640 [Burkholderia ubonensis]
MQDQDQDQDQDLNRTVGEIRSLLSGGAAAALPGVTGATVAPALCEDDVIIAWLAALGGADLVIPWSADDLVLYGNDASLAAGQVGYRVDGAGRRFGGWQDDWIVLGQIGSDPVVGVRCDDGCRVLFARHGAGAWTPAQVAGSPAQFATALRIWCALQIGQYANDILDDTYAIRPAFLADLRARIGEVLPDAEAAVFMEMVDD